jgi:OmpA-OmpF porin, OOP family
LFLEDPVKIKPLGKLVILLLVLGASLGGYRLWSRFGDKLVPAAPTKSSQVPQKIDLPNASSSGEAPGTPSTPAGPVGGEPGCTDKPEVRLLHWAWNAQMGLIYAVGGSQSAKGSLMCSKNVNLRLIRQDDGDKMKEALVAFATALKNHGGNPSEGAHFVVIMGDGAATFLKGLNDTLSKLGPEYTAKVVCTLGYSRGEDKFMGPPEWKQNPPTAMGGVVAGVLRDGDWNIAQKWLGDNGLKNNPDEKTYDPDALNWVNAPSYTDAAEKYVAGYSEDRPVVRNGKKTGETKHITVQGVVTWTPGDVTASQKKGGIVSIASTREYASQMPAVVIGIDKWMKLNRVTVDNMIAAALEGGSKVRSDREAFRKAAELSALVYNEKGCDAGYWEKYFNVVVEKDKTGLDVELGGSSVNGLNDALLCFGMLPNSANMFGATYRVFGDLVVSQYPELVPNYPPVGRILDTSYLREVADHAKPAEKVAPKPLAPAFEQASGAKPAHLKRVLSRKAWNIQFQTGSANFNPQATSVLEKLSRDLLVAAGAGVEIHGHTDNVGSADANMKLSEARAFAVKTWLEKRARLNFQGRIRVFAEGSTNPVAPNATEEGRARNRRVEIVIGAN